MGEVTPVLETERLRLRGRSLEDFPFFRALWADPVVTRYIGDQPLTEEQTWAKFLRAMGHWLALGFGYWAIEHKSSGALMGEAGFGEFKREMKPLIRGEPEAGWVFLPAFHGKGYAAEAVGAMLAWGDAYFDGTRMSCIIEPENTASIRLAERFGFRETSRGAYNGDELIVYHRPV
ncbi:MAG: GNAT family N-acetyltransferase [Pseudomonadota bacterium]